jgi:branched-chain amino acid transport system ATP-binding protein
MLRISDLIVSYGKIPVLTGVSFEVPDKEIVCLLGGNGSGKTTTLKTIVGLLKPSGGTIKYNGTRIDHLNPYEIIPMGISLIPQGRMIFPDLTVTENLMMGTFTSWNRKKIKGSIERMMDLFPVIREKRKSLAGSLSVGQQQLVAIARGLMADPQLLLMDEPSAGLAPLVVSEVFEVISQINSLGKTILLVEQNVRMAISVSAYCHILKNGEICVSNRSTEIRGDEELIKSYLGD